MNDDAGPTLISLLNEFGSRRFPWLVALCAGLAACGQGGSPTETDSIHAPLTDRDRLRFADFNADGYSDLVMAAPYESISSAADGAVTVLYGSSTGLVTTGAQKWSLSSAGVPGVPSAMDRLGTAVAWGDFDGNGVSDLAIGVPDYGVGGAVLVLYGSAASRVSSGGLTTQGARLITLGDAFRTPEPGDGFGASLVALNMGGDAAMGLAVGIPYRDHDQGADTGAVQVFRGGASGLSVGPFVQPYDTFEGHSGFVLLSHSQFGYALAAGDTDADGTDELVVGAPYARSSYAGGPTFGSFGVVHLPNYQICWTRIYEPHNTDADGKRGAALAMGDFDADGDDDLAVAAPRRHVGGTVEFFHGVPTPSRGAPCSSFGIDMAGSPVQLWQELPPILEPSEAGDSFGAALAAADFDDDGDADVAIGSHGNDSERPAREGAGAVWVLDPGDDYAQRLSQELEGVFGDVHDNDYFGYALMAGDFDGDDGADLAVAAPGDHCGSDSAVRGGSYQVFYSTGYEADAYFWLFDPQLLHPDDPQLFHQDKAGIPDTCEQNDRVGMLGGFRPVADDPGL